MVGLLAPQMMSKNTSKGTGEETPPTILSPDRMVVALDVATSLGVVYKHPNGKFYCTTYKGTPVQQLEMLLDVLGDDVTTCLVIIEQLNDFMNANTTRSLLERIGYLKNSLLKVGADIKMVNAMSVRKYLGVKGKEGVKELFSKYGLDSDQSDALAVMLYGLELSPDVLTEDNVCRL